MRRCRAPRSRPSSSPTERAAAPRTRAVISGPRTRRRRRRRLLAWAIALVTAVGVLALAGLPVYVFPAGADPHRAPASDVVFVLGPPTLDRVADAVAVQEATATPAMLISIVEPSDEPGALAAMVPDECAQSGTTCVMPEPFSTLGEAQLLAAHAEQTGATSAVVVTATPHVARTRYLMEKCSGVETTVVGIGGPDSFSGWARQYLYQSAAFAKAWITPCE